MGKKAKPSSTSEAKDAKIQAIVLADSFTNTCRPISLERPKVLFPLCGTPMLSYVLEFLESAKVDEVLVFCSSFSEKVKEFLENSRWKTAIAVPGGGGLNEVSRMSVKTVASGRTSSAGEALREIDNSNLVTSEPFVLISGDVVCNIDLASVISAHKRRKELDKENIMTVVLKKANADHRTRPLSDDLVVVFDSETKQILRYDNDSCRSSVEFEATLLEEHEGIEFRYDLMDCNVDVCSLEMLLRISDEYDYEDLRNDFIRREVQNRELGHKIYGHVVQNEYAARVHCPRTYDAVCRDVIRRWAYPLVPDNNIDGTSFEYSRVNHYKEAGVEIGWSAFVGSDTVIGAKTNICEGAHIEQSVIGRHCSVARNARIRRSHLWNNVEIHEGSIVDQAILCDNVIVMKNAHVQKGTILSFGVIIGATVMLDPFSRITCLPPPPHCSNTPLGTVSWYEKEVVGEDGKGRAWNAMEELDEEDIIGECGNVKNMKEALEKDHRRNCMGCLEYDEVIKRWQDWGDVGETAMLVKENEEEDLTENTFEVVIAQMIYDSFDDGLNIATLDLEIGCYKRAENMTWAETLSACVPAILKLVDTSQKHDQKGLLQSTEVTFAQFKGLIEKMCEQGDEVEMALIEALEKYLVSDDSMKSIFRPLFPMLLKQFWHDMEVLSESVIDKWATEREGLPEDDPLRILVYNKHTRTLLHHVREALAASSTDSEDDSSGQSSSSEDR